MTKIETIAGDVKWIRNTLEGNGQKGLIRKVDENTSYRLTRLGAAVEKGKIEGMKRSTLGWIIAGVYVIVEYVLPRLFG